MTLLSARERVKQKTSAISGLGSPREYKRKLEKDIRCLLEYGMKEFGGRWNFRIICVLATLGTLCYSELRKNGQYVLASALKDLIANGIIDRQSFDEIPPRVEYLLSERGKYVVPILQSICQ